MRNRLIARALVAVLALPLGAVPVTAQPVGQPVAELCQTLEGRAMVERSMNIGGVELEAPDECLRIVRAWLLRQPTPERPITLLCESYVKHTPGTSLGECSRDITAWIHAGGH